MGTMTENHPHGAPSATSEPPDYLPAAGLHALLPGFDLISRLFGTPAMHERLIALAELRDGQRVLEIGCGTGNLTTKAKRARPGIDIVGSDPDPRALARARRKAHGLGGIRFDHGYAQQLPYADGEFDRVFSALMLHHLPGEVKAGAAAEAFRVLRPGGQLHVLDVGGAPAPQTLGVRRVMLTDTIAQNFADGIPRLLRSVGFTCEELASQPHRAVGRVTFYRAVHPA